MDTLTIGRRADFDTAWNFISNALKRLRLGLAAVKESEMRSLLPAAKTEIEKESNNDRTGKSTA